MRLLFDKMRNLILFMLFWNCISKSFPTLHTQVYTGTHTGSNVRTCVHTGTHVYTHAQVHTCIYTHRYTHLHTHICTHIYMENWERDSYMSFMALWLHFENTHILKSLQLQHKNHLIPNPDQKIGSSFYACFLWTANVWSKWSFSWVV